MMQRSALRRLIGDRGGTAIVELAIAAPIFATMLVGMVDLGRAYSTKLELEQASQRAIEKVMNGQADTTTANALANEAATTAGVPLSQVAVDYWLECDGARAGTYSSSCAVGKVSRRYMTVQITKAFSPMFAVRWAGSNADGSFTLLGKTGVRIQ